MQRLVLAAAAAALAALPATASAAPDVSARPANELASFQDQVLDWRACFGSSECARLTVPLDYANPGGATISLAITRIRATGTRMGSLLANPGGP
ncbi:MAG: hypothetical protein ACR2KE_07060 [Candidatus Nanopelagicales bacterium]